MSVDNPNAYSKRSIDWDKRDVIVVSGGAKGITAECAIAFAKKYGTSMALLGSSSEDKVGKDLEAFRAASINFRYFACDISDSRSVTTTISMIKSEMGEIRGLIHGAGRNNPKLFMNTSFNEIYSEIAPKVMGIKNLLSALRDSNLKMVAALTSILGIDNLPGNAWYGYSNGVCRNLVSEFLRDNPTSSGVCIAYGMWADVGMAARLGSGDKLSKYGVKPIPRNEGVLRFLALLDGNPGRDEIVITSGMWDSGLVLKPNKQNIEANRFLGITVTGLDKVEVLCESYLTLKDDRYIEQHCYEGTYLFPTVMGLEAMAQASMFVTGNKSPKWVKFQNVKLERPITVPENAGVKIQVWGVLLEGDFVRPTVKCSIRTEATKFKVDHFSALVTLDVPLSMSRTDLSKIVAQPVDIQLIHDSLFQGRDFKKFHEVGEINSGKLVYKGQVERTAAVTAKAFSSRVAAPLILGDLYMRDSMLQAFQVMNFQHDLLPFWCDEWHIQTIRSSAMEVVEATGSRDDQSKTTTGGVVSVATRGQVMEVIKGLKNKILRALPQRKVPEKLVS